MQITLDKPILEADKEVVSHNLAMMEKDMRTLANGESMGGNAGSITIDGKKYPCVGLNGYADKHTGRILAFGNYQDISQAIRMQGIEFTLREAVNLDINAFLAAFKNRADKSEDIHTFSASYTGNTSKIVDFVGANGFSEKGRKNIETAIQNYNAKHWSS